MRSLVILSIIFLNVAFTPTRKSARATAENENKIEFSIINAGIEVTGRMQCTYADIKFDQNQLNESAIVAVADPASINTGIAIRDKHLKKADYFDITHFSEIRLASKTFKKIGKNKFTGVFDLTIKNITQPIKIVFDMESEDSVIRYHGSFQLNRLDFNLGEKSLIMADQVAVTILATRPI